MDIEKENQINRTGDQQRVLTLNRESDIIKVQKYANGLRKEVATWHQSKKEETVTG